MIYRKGIVAVMKIKAEISALLKKARNFIDDKTAEISNNKKEKRLLLLGEKKKKLEEEITANSKGDVTSKVKTVKSIDEKILKISKGKYYYSLYKKDKREKEKAQKCEKIREKRIADIEGKIAKIPQTDVKKIRSLEKKKHKASIGKSGVYREKSEKVKLDIKDTQDAISRIDEEIHQEKISGIDETGKTLEKLQKKKKVLQKKEIKQKDSLRVLQRNGKFLTIGRRKSLFGFAFVSPWVFGFFLLFLYPIVQTVRLSVGDVTDIMKYSIEFKGFDEYSRILFEEPDVLLMLLNVLKDSFINMVLITVFAFYIAILLNKKFKFRGLFRVLCFLPVMLGTGFIMEQLLAQNITEGSMQAVTDFILPKEIVTYIGPKVQNAIVFFLSKLTVILWHSGVQILLFLSGLQSISPSLYEAARVDGATKWESLWFITVPMMTPMILLNLVFTIVETFNDSSNDIIGRIQKYAFTYNQFSYAAAMGVFFAFFALVLVGLVFLVMRPFTNNVKS